MIRALIARLFGHSCAWCHARVPLGRDVEHALIDHAGDPR